MISASSAGPCGPRRTVTVPQPARQHDRHAPRVGAIGAADRLVAVRCGVRRALRREGPAWVADPVDGRAASAQAHGGVSDEQVCAQWIENAYFQFFCGETYFQPKLPLDRTSMSVWRGRIGADKLEAAARRDAGAARRAKAVDPQMQRVTVDTTAQTKAVAHPTDSHLLMRAIEWLNRLAKRHGIAFAPVLPAAGEAGPPRSLPPDPWPGSQTGRCAVCAKCGPGRAGWFATSAARSTGEPDLQTLAPSRSSGSGGYWRKSATTRTRLYALHAPEVECIAKGKARTRYEFGVKTSIAVTNARAAGGQFIVGMRPSRNSLRRPHAEGQIAQVERLTGVAVARVYVDKGYRGHGLAAPDIHITQSPGQRPTIAALNLKHSIHLLRRQAVGVRDVADRPGGAFPRPQALPEPPEAAGVDLAAIGGRPKLRRTHMDAVQESGNLIASDKVKGTYVFNAAGEELGAIYDIMIDKPSGKVAYAILSSADSSGWETSIIPCLGRSCITTPKRAAMSSISTSVSWKAPPPMTKSGARVGDGTVENRNPRLLRRRSLLDDVGDRREPRFGVAFGRLPVDGGSAGEDNA